MHCQRRRGQHRRRPLMALQPAQRVWAAGMDQPPDRGQVGADVALEDGLVMGDAVAQVADASDIRMDGFPDGTGMSRGACCRTLLSSGIQSVESKRQVKSCCQNTIGRLATIPGVSVTRLASCSSTVRGEVLDEVGSLRRKALFQGQRGPCCLASTAAAALRVTTSHRWTGIISALHIRMFHRYRDSAVTSGLQLDAILS